jgi:ATP-dependent 26S proteasome regulatory subunit
MNIISSRLPVLRAPAREQTFRKANSTQEPPPERNLEERVSQAIGSSIPRISEAMKPVADLVKGVEMTRPENKEIASKVSEFSNTVRVLGAQSHPFTSYENMLESWLGATPFHQSSQTREVARLLPGLKYKGVHDVVNQDYKVLHAVAAEGWNKKIVAPKFSRIRTDYNSYESIPTEVVYLVEDENKNRLVVELRREWPSRPPQLTVFAHNAQPELIDTFYEKLTSYVDKNNFYKNKVLHYVEPPMASPYMDFQDGLREKATTWNDIALPEKSEELIKTNTVEFLDNLDVYRENGKFANRNLLLAGPPGTGKSMVNDILMTELKNEATFVYVTSKSVNSSDSISGIFDAARMLSPSVVLMEDLDLVGGTNRDDASRQTLLNELLNQLSGVYDNTGMVVIGSTNQASAFDHAMLRPLRFSTIVPMPLPSPELRKTILSRITTGMKMARDVNLEDIAARAEDFTGAGLTELKEMAIQQAIERGSVDNEGIALVRAVDFDRSLELIRLKKEYMEQLRRDEQGEQGPQRPKPPQDDQGGQ